MEFGCIANWLSRVFCPCTRGKVLNWMKWMMESGAEEGMVAFGPEGGYREILERADFSMAKMKGADFSMANVKWADFSTTRRGYLERSDVVMEATGSWVYRGGGGWTGS